MARPGALWAGWQKRWSQVPVSRSPPLYLAMTPCVALLISNFCSIPRDYLERQISESHHSHRCHLSRPEAPDTKPRGVGSWRGHLGFGQVSRLGNITPTFVYRWVKKG